MRGAIGGGFSSTGDHIHREWDRPGIDGAGCIGMPPRFDSTGGDFSWNGGQVVAASETKNLTRFEPFAIKWTRFPPSLRPGLGGKKEIQFEKERCVPHLRRGGRDEKKSPRGSSGRTIVKKTVLVHPVWRRMGL